MEKTQPQFLTVGEGDTSRKIAYIQNAPEGDDQNPTGIIWHLGLKSDMVSTKATALREWAPKNGYGLTRFEYSGHGSSQGAFEDATIGDWLEESREVFNKLTTGPQILVGSSTGGHVALLLLRDLINNDPNAAKRIKGLVLIAPAWDLTEELFWNAFPEDAKRDIMEKGIYMMPSDYGEPYAITRKFIEEGRNHLFARKPFDPGCPIIVLQGQEDKAVPPQHARDLVSFIENGRAKLNEVKDGDHSLSRPQDLELLFDAINTVRNHK